MGTIVEMEDKNSRLHRYAFDIVASATGIMVGMAEEEIVKEPVKEPVAEPATESKSEPVAEQISSEALVQTIDEKLKKMNRVDYLTISVNRTGLIVGVGILIVFLWLMPLVNLGLDKLTKGQFSLANLRSDAVFGISQPESDSVCPETKTGVKLRLKTKNDSFREINQIETALHQAGFNLIETVFDPDITNSGVLIVTRDGDQELREKLAAVLKDGYQMSSEAATLTEDSDFSAAILVGSDSAIPARD